MPVPNGWTEPRFDWTEFRAKLPDVRELEAWLRPDIGCGVVCGKVSGNLVAFEFISNRHYEEWVRENLGAADEAPCFQDGDKVVAFFRTHETMRSGAIYMPGRSGKLGHLISDGRIVVLPPTRHADNSMRHWIRPVGSRLSEQALDYMEPHKRDPSPLYKRTLEEFGVYTKTSPVAPRQRTAAKAGREQEGWDESVLDPREVRELFVAAPDYLGSSEENEMFWIVEGLLPETYLAVLAGSTKCGKSCLVTALAMAVATGEPFLNLPTTKAPVLWVAYEESREERALALKPFGKTPEDLYICHQQIPIDTDKGIAMLRHWVRQTKAKLIVIDPLYAATTVETLSDGRSARDALAGLKELCRVEKCAAVVLHHLTKNSYLGMSRERFADSHQILAVASMDLLMDADFRPDGTRRIWLHGRGRGEFANRSWLIRSSSMSEYELEDAGSGFNVAQTQSDRDIFAAIQSLDEPTAETIADAVGKKVGALRNRLTELSREGKVQVAGKVGKAVTYEVTNLSA